VEARGPGGAPESEAARRLGVLERTYVVARDLTSEAREDLRDAEEEEAAIADRCDKARAEVQALRASGGTSAMAKRAADEAIRSATERAMDIMRKGAEQAARLNADAARLRELERARALEEEVEEQTAKCRRLAAGSTRLATDKAGRR
jgi:hypothetical protein